MEELKKFATEELVEELKNRIGVNFTEVPPHKEIDINVSGPSIIIEVID